MIQHGINLRVTTATVYLPISMSSTNYTIVATTGYYNTVGNVSTTYTIAFGSRYKTSFALKSNYTEGCTVYWMLIGN